MKEGKSETKGVSAVPGLVVFGLMLTGFAGIVHSFEFGTPVSLIASSLSFGLIFYVTFN